MQNLFRIIVPVIWKQNFSGFPLRFITSNNGYNKKDANKAEFIAWEDSLGAADKKRVRYIQNEITLILLKQQQSFGPEDVTVSEYKQLLALSRTQRSAFYKNLRKRKLTAISTEIKATVRRKFIAQYRENKQLESELNNNEPEHIKYELSGCALIPRVLPKTIDRWDNLRGFGALARNEPKLIFDCGFEHALTTRDIADTAKQILTSFGENRRHCMPFVMHLCNLHQNGLLWKFLTKEMPTLESPYTPIQVHKEDYCDLFPKKQLVLLTPQSPNILEEYDPNMHYVLGGYISRHKNLPHLMTKAKKLQLQTAHFPINAFQSLRLNYGKLPLNQIVRILLEVKCSQNWNKAIDRIAKRHIK